MKIILLSIFIDHKQAKRTREVAIDLFMNDHVIKTEKEKVN